MTCTLPGCVRDHNQTGHHTDLIPITPAEDLALTVAWAQVLRGEHPGPAVARVCVVALARLAGRDGTT